MRSLRRCLLPCACAALAIAILTTGLCEAGEADGPAEKVRVEELVNRMDEFDGRTVAIEGEVIGDVMRRGDHAWITVNDDAYSERNIEEGGGFAGYSNIGIGVWVEARQTDAIRYLGSYNARGDRVRVVGVFNRIWGSTEATPTYTRSA